MRRSAPQMNENALNLWSVVPRRGRGLSSTGSIFYPVNPVNPV